MVSVITGSRGQSRRKYFGAGEFFSGLQRFSFSVKTLAEESPDCKEQGVLLKRRMLRTIFRRKTSATEIIPLQQWSKGEMVG